MIDTDTADLHEHLSSAIDHILCAMIEAGLDLGAEAPGDSQALDLALARSPSFRAARRTLSAALAPMMAECRSEAMRIEEAVNAALAIAVDVGWMLGVKAQRGAAPG